MLAECRRAKKTKEVVCDDETTTCWSARYGRWGLLLAQLGATAAAPSQDDGDILAALAMTAQTDEAPDVLSGNADPATLGVTVPYNSADPVVLDSGTVEIEVTLPGAAATAAAAWQGAAQSELANAQVTSANTG